MILAAIISDLENELDVFISGSFNSKYKLHIINDLLVSWEAFVT